MLQPILHCAAIALYVTILVGLFVRRRARAVMLLPVWLVALMAQDGLALLHPDLNTWPFWITKELAYLALTGLMGLEIGARMGGHLPAVRRRLTLGIVACGLYFAATLVGAPAPLRVSTLAEIALGVAYLYGWVYVCGLWCVLPLDALHRVLLPGVFCTQVLYAVTWHRVLDDATVAGHVNVYAFLVLLAALARAAWTRDDAADVPAHVRRFLWPWHA